ncbi:MAG TPA: VTT domain-containing protein [Candidatus Angelobacter sp.]|nr:VTT domain-containing protein [Candidatus Angelobacter sp.]
MSDYLLTQIINYGAPLFGLILFIGALGVPVPASILLVAAGAFSQQGVLDITSTALLGLIGAVAGDSLSFGMGYFAKEWVDKRFGGMQSWKSAQDTFASRAGLAVYLTRFLITALAIPTNLIAGGSGFRFRNFLTYDVAGETTWILLYGGLGYWFGSEWELVSNFINNFGGLMVGIVILIAGIVLAIRWSRSTASQIRHAEKSIE